MDPNYRRVKMLAGSLYFCINEATYRGHGAFEHRTPPRMTAIRRLRSQSVTLKRRAHVKRTARLHGARRASNKTIRHATLR